MKIRPGAQHRVEVLPQTARQPDTQRLRQIAAAALPGLRLTGNSQLVRAARLVPAGHLLILVGQNPDFPAARAKVGCVTFTD